MDNKYTKLCSRLRLGEATIESEQNKQELGVI